MPLIRALTQVDLYDFMTNLVYVACIRPAKATRETLSHQKKKWTSKQRNKSLASQQSRPPLFCSRAEGKRQRVLPCNHHPSESFHQLTFEKRVIPVTLRWISIYHQRHQHFLWENKIKDHKSYVILLRLWGRTQLFIQSPGTWFCSKTKQIKS